MRRAGSGAAPRLWAGSPCRSLTSGSKWLPIPVSPSASCHRVHFRRRVQRADARQEAAGPLAFYGGEERQRPLRLAQLLPAGQRHPAGGTSCRQAKPRCSPCASDTRRRSRWQVDFPSSAFDICFSTPPAADFCPQYDFSRLDAGSQVALRDILHKKAFFW